jgi:uncharacterized membrane protein
MKDPLLIVIMLLAGFVLVVSIASLHSQEEISSGMACTFLPSYLLIPIMASAGLFVGSGVYYYISEYQKRNGNGKQRDISPILRFLSNDERAIISELVRRKGSATQANLVAATGINKVKVSRMLADLEQRSIVKKKAKGISNIIELEEKLKELLVG